MTDVLKVNASYKMPKIKCFDKDTLLTMNDGSLKKIIHVKVGDILSNNNFVTAKVKVITEGSTMFRLNNVIVSDSHIVKYKTKWIPVCQHPDAIKCEHYDEEFLYCLNTSHKIININNTIYTDWDELYGDKLNNILNNNIICIKNVDSIHKHLDCGFVGSTKVCLKDGLHKDISNIKVNDLLENGEKVYGVVEIDGSTILEQFSYNLGKNTFVEGYAPNLTFITKKNTKTTHKLYHILTDKGTLKIQNTIIKDYNAAIDRFLKK
jgi:hypothetical protein